MKISISLVVLFLVVLCSGLRLANGQDSKLVPSSPAPPATAERTLPTEMAKPFLYLPFDKWREMEIVISETDKYSPRQRAIHGFSWHYGVDFDAPQGTQLYAPCSGWAVQGFQTALVRDAKGGPVLYQDKVIGLGLGHFVQIYCKDSDLYVTLAHMQEVRDNIPTVAESQSQKTLEYSPDGIYRQWPDKDNSKWVKRGYYLGRVGHSGLGWGEFEVPFVWTQNSWDSFHVYLEVYKRTEDGHQDVQFRYDPFGWYTEVSKAPYRELKQSSLGLWVTDKSGKIEYACNQCSP